MSPSSAAGVMSARACRADARVCIPDVFVVCMIDVYALMNGTVCEMNEMETGYLKGVPFKVLCLFDNGIMSV